MKKRMTRVSLSSAKIAAKHASGFGERAATWLFTDGSTRTGRNTTKLDEVDPGTGRSRRDEATLVGRQIYNINMKMASQ